MTITYRTEVRHLPPTPLGLLSECWRIEYQCTLCHDQVAPDRLIAHARDHEGEGHDSHIELPKYK